MLGGRVRRPSVGDRAYTRKLAVYLEHFAPRTATGSLFLPGPVTEDSWAALTAAVGVGADAADGQPARLSVPGIEPVDGTVEFVASPSFVGMRTDDAMYLLIHGYNDMVFATAHYFDDRDPSTETEAWQNWLGGLAPDHPTVTRRRHPVLLARLAAAQTAASLEATRDGWRTLRRDVGRTLPPEVLEEAMAAYEHEGGRLVELGRQVDAVRQAVDGKVWVPGAGRWTTGPR